MRQEGVVFLKQSRRRHVSLTNSRSKALYMQTRSYPQKNNSMATNLNTDDKIPTHQETTSGHIVSIPATMLLTIRRSMT